MSEIFITIINIAFLLIIALGILQVSILLVTALIQLYKGMATCPACLSSVSWREKPIHCPSCGVGLRWGN